MIQTLCVSSFQGLIRRLRSLAMICLFFLQKISFLDLKLQVFQIFVEESQYHGKVFDVVYAFSLMFCLAEMNILINI